MRFRLPFDEVQWDTASKHHANIRLYLRRLREDHPPISSAQRDLMKGLRDLIQDFGRELLKPHDRIDPSRLNELSAAMTRVAVEYMAMRQMTR